MTIFYIFMILALQLKKSEKLDEKIMNFEDLIDFKPILRHFDSNSRQTTFLFKNQSRLI